MSQTAFDIVIVNGRPAAGKSEIIDFLKKTPLSERIARFHIGEVEELDDFPILWERFEDDDLLESMGHPRLISAREYEYRGARHPGYVFKEEWYWHFMIRKLNAAYARILRDRPTFHQTHTLLLEFSRGSQHGGFTTAYRHLAPEILSRAVTLYISISWEESLRKNRRRYNPDRPDSWLQHALEDQKLEMLYKESDWETFAGRDARFLEVAGQRIPYAVFDNMPEKTDCPEHIAPPLEEACRRLWQIKQGI